MKRLFCMLLSMMVMISVTGCGSNELKVELPSKTIIVEYGDSLDNRKLFDVKKSDEKIKVDKVVGYQSKKVGKQELTITFTDGVKTIDKSLTIEVKDTKKPVITFKKSSMTITVGDHLDIKGNIKSVIDIVDGGIKYVDKKVSKNGYWIEKGNLNLKKTGKYDVLVIAVDVNGNRSEKSMKVIVEKKEEKKASKETTNANMSQGSSSNKNSSPSQKETSKESNSDKMVTQKPNKDTNSSHKNEIIRPKGNSGWIGTYDEVVAKAYQAAEDPNSKWFDHGWKGWTVNGSGTLWTIEFYQ